jgi:hypothetical protein
VTTGRLVLVATPIGNLGDLSPRAVQALDAAVAIVCEDTRRTGRLLAHAGVASRRMLVANEHTEAACAVTVATLLEEGAVVAVVTDAGTPGISDPGARIVRVAIDGGHVVEAVPGASALLAALVVSLAALVPAGRAEPAPPDSFLHQYAATFRFRLGRPVSIHVTPSGDAVLYLRSGPRNFVQDLYAFDTRTGQEQRLLTAEQILRGTLENLSTAEKARRERMRLAARRMREPWRPETAGPPPSPYRGERFVWEAICE